MKLDELEEMWNEECEINPLDLTGETVNIPKLHAKYYTMYVKENIRLAKMKAKKAELVRNKTEYYRGDMDREEQKQLGYIPLDKHILKADVPTYVETDKEVVTATLAVNMQQSIVKMLEDITKQISTRNFLIKNIIDWERFRSGG